MGIIVKETLQMTAIFWTTFNDSTSLKLYYQHYGRKEFLILIHYYEEPVLKNEEMRFTPRLKRVGKPRLYIYSHKILCSWTLFFTFHNYNYIMPFTATVLHPVL